MKWQVKKLSEVCNIQPPKKESKQNLSQEDFVSFVPMNCLGILSKDLALEEEKKLKDVYKAYVYFAENDVLLAKITPCFENGKLGIAKNLKNGVGFGSSEYIVFRSKGDINPEYLFYFLSRNQFRVEGARVMSGAVGHKRVPKEFIEDYLIPVPPLEEQKRIVEILDESFAGIERAEAIARQNLTNARELFDSYLANLLNKASKIGERKTLQQLLDTGWIESHLDGNHGEKYPRKSEFVSSGVPYISANCIKNQKIDFSLSKFLTPERALSLTKGIAKNRDVIFAHNATVGPVVMLATTYPKVILSTSLTYYRCNPDYIYPEYLTIYMQSEDFKSQYELVMRQSTRNQVPITKQRTFIHLIPPLKIQKKIAHSFKKLDIKITRLKEIYQRKIEALGELKQSILQKAFSGQLTQQIG